MRNIAGMRLGVKGWREALRAREPFVVQFGAAHATELIVLPAGEWADYIELVYGDGGRRLDVDHRSLKESVVTDILTNQANSNMKPWTYGFINVSQTAGAYLVPASPFWRARVEGER